jgi:radical SAM superfamily enzyme with C-terminal helix-hairpin-helix motif
MLATGEFLQWTCQQVTDAQLVGHLTQVVSAIPVTTQIKKAAHCQRQVLRQMEALGHVTDTLIGRAFDLTRLGL